MSVFDMANEVLSNHVTDEDSLDDDDISSQPLCEMKVFIKAIYFSFK